MPVLESTVEPESLRGTQERILEDGPLASADDETGRISAAPPPSGSPDAPAEIDSHTVDPAIHEAELALLREHSHWSAQAIANLQSPDVQIAALDRLVNELGYVDDLSNEERSEPVAMYLLYNAKSDEVVHKLESIIEQPEFQWVMDSWNNLVKAENAMKAEAAMPSIEEASIEAALMAGHSVDAGMFASLRRSRAQILLLENPNFNQSFAEAYATWIPADGIDKSLPNYFRAFARSTEVLEAINAGEAKLMEMQQVLEAMAFQKGDLRFTDIENFSVPLAQIVALSKMEFSPRTVSEWTRLHPDEPLGDYLVSHAANDRVELAINSGLDSLYVLVNKTFDIRDFAELKSRRGQRELLDKLEKDPSILTIPNEIWDELGINDPISKWFIDNARDPEIVDRISKLESENPGYFERLVITNAESVDISAFNNLTTAQMQLAALEKLSIGSGSVREYEYYLAKGVALSKRLEDPALIDPAERAQVEAELNSLQEQYLTTSLGLDVGKSMLWNSRSPEVRDKLEELTAVFIDADRIFTAAFARPKNFVDYTLILTPEGQAASIELGVVALNREEIGDLILDAGSQRVREVLMQKLFPEGIVNALENESLIDFLSRHSQDPAEARAKLEPLRESLENLAVRTSPKVDYEQVALLTTESAWLLALDKLEFATGAQSKIQNLQTELARLKSAGDIDGIKDVEAKLSKLPIYPEEGLYAYFKRQAKPLASASINDALLALKPRLDALDEIFRSSVPLEFSTLSSSEEQLLALHLNKV
ncbi:MAG: hypothetical protein KDD53_06725, partial [Bdellovibrionales bacterium]|nr:hypothetical protein [Bdellovibrionales bacterium]